MKEIKSLQEYKDILSNDYVIVDIFAEWCGPCKKITKPLEDLEKEYPDIVFTKMDIDKMDDMGITFEQPETIPCLLYYKNGVEVSRLMSSSMALIKNRLLEHL